MFFLETKIMSIRGNTWKRNIMGHVLNGKRETEVKYNM